VIQAITMQSTLRTAFLDAHVSAGRPLEVSPDHTYVDLNQLVSDGNYQTLLVRVHGESMSDCGIGDGDMVVMSERKPQTDNAIVVARINGEYVIKRAQKSYNGRRGLFLVPANPNYETREVTEGDTVEIVGTVLFHIRQV
jgi:SOS-response transcriptional repressor LexA